MTLETHELLKYRLATLEHINASKTFFEPKIVHGEMHRNGFVDASNRASYLTAKKLADDLLPVGWANEINAQPIDAGSLIGNDKPTQIKPAQAALMCLSNIVSVAAVRDANYASGEVRSSPILNDAIKLMKKCTPLEEDDNLLHLLSFLKENTVTVTAVEKKSIRGQFVKQDRQAEARHGSVTAVAPTTDQQVNAAKKEEFEAILPIFKEGWKKQVERGTNDSRKVWKAEKALYIASISLACAGIFGGMAVAAVPLLVAAGAIKLAKNCSAPPKSLTKFIRDDGTFSNPAIEGKPSIQETYEHWQKYMNKASSSAGMIMNLRLKKLSAVDLRNLVELAKKSDPRGSHTVEAFNAAFKTLSSSSNPAHESMQKLSSNKAVATALAVDVGFIAGASALGVAGAHYIIEPFAHVVHNLMDPILPSMDTIGEVFGHRVEHVVERVGEKVGETIADVGAGIAGAVYLDRLQEKLRERLKNRNDKPAMQDAATATHGRSGLPSVA